MVRIRSRPRRVPDPADTDPGETAALTTSFWRAYDKRMASIGFMAMLREFPSLVFKAVRLGYQASKIDMVGTIGLNLAAGFFTGYALLATTGVLHALFAAGPTPARVKAAIPSLVLVSAAAAIRAGLQAAAGWAEGRLGPHVNRAVELRLYDLTTQVELAAFDDSGFHDAMQRARDRGLYSAPQVVAAVINCVTGITGLVSAGVVVGVLNPLLLVLLACAGALACWSRRVAVLRSFWGVITRTTIRDAVTLRDHEPSRVLNPGSAADGYGIRPRAVCTLRSSSSSST